MTLALRGGKPAITTEILPANHIGYAECKAAYLAVSKHPLSGYLGGQKRGGKLVRELEDRWAEKFMVRHAVACNSATSGLLASCVACGVSSSSRVNVPCFTMSATAAAPAFLGADLWFGDCDRDDFCLREWEYQPDVLIVTNLFGHPAELATIKQVCKERGTYLIEDNAQAIGALEGQTYAGTAADIGVFSLNVHKSIQAGEGGICVTDDDGFADHLRGFINHGELDGYAWPGLNLRMTEYTAAIAIEQLKKLWDITEENIAQAEALTVMARGFPWLIPPVVRDDCKHVYYCWACKTKGIDSKIVVDNLNAEGFPVHKGYVEPLYRLPAFRHRARPCPVAETLHASELFLFENTLHLLTRQQVDQFGEALLKIEKEYYK